MMNVEISVATSNKIAAILKEQDQELADLPAWIGALLRRIAADDDLLRSLLVTESLSEKELSESLQEIDLALGDIESAKLRPAREALLEMANDLGLTIDR